MTDAASRAALRVLSGSTVDLELGVRRIRTPPGRDIKVCENWRRVLPREGPVKYHLDGANGRTVIGIWNVSLSSASLGYVSRFHLGGGDLHRSSSEL